MTVIQVGENVMRRSGDLTVGEIVTDPIPQHLHGCFTDHFDAH